MVNMLLGTLDSAGGWNDHNDCDLDQDLPAELEKLCRRCSEQLENGDEAALETEMLKQQLETVTTRGLALRPALLQRIARILTAALF